MKQGVLILFVALGLALSAQSQDTKPAETTRPVPSREELEKSFQEQLANCEFVGRWSLVENGALGEEKEERYNIINAQKAGNDLWIIRARVQYGDKDVTVPVPVYVKWAGDTPVITLTDAAIPNLGTYSARVVIHEGKYAGTWSGGKHTGFLHGVIKKKSVSK